MKQLSVFALFLLLSLQGITQVDTGKVKTLDSIFINRILDKTNFLPNVSGAEIFAGQKTNFLTNQIMDGNLAANVQRTVFARIPGLNTWEMDGAGIELNIGSRGTDAHRSIEMNMRQNGYNTNSDLFGYPEDHYTMPLQAVDHIQYVRGASALQFGPQFGGMMNFILKRGDTTRPFALESEQTAGGNNFFNSYNAIGGTVKHLNYYAYYDYRGGDGWRDDSRFDYHSYYVNLSYDFGKRGDISFQFSRMNYVQQIAGGLTDEQFKSNSRQATRTRNFFQPEINIPAIIFNYSLSANTKLNVTSNMIIGQRNSVQFINAPDVKDTFNLDINSYNPRQVDRDYYRGFATEMRLLHNYKLSGGENTLAFGVRYSTQSTKREQKGVGTTGSDFDLSLTEPYGIDLHLNTDNYAVYVQNIFNVVRNLLIIPGVRYEIIKSSMRGVINNASDAVAFGKTRNFPLAGLGLQYQLQRKIQLYANFSQAYRPFLYANITPATQLDVIDPNLKDSKGFDIDFGIRGDVNRVLKFDINPYYLSYRRRIGLLTFKDADNIDRLLTTNIGNSVSKGVETYVELIVFKMKYTSFISIFNSLAYNHARYVSGSLNKSGINADIKNNFVENSPDWLERAGINFQYKKVNTSFQYSYTSKSFNDALNTVYSSNGVTGVIPQYHVWDWSFKWAITTQYVISVGVDNFTNEKYFNRRITFYPGPGILPADGRTFYVSGKIRL